MVTQSKVGIVVVALGYTRFAGRVHFSRQPPPFRAVHVWHSMQRDDFDALRLGMTDSVCGRSTVRCAPVRSS